MTVQMDVPEYQNAQRFPGWLGLSVFSAVCLAAANSQSDKSERDASEKWIMSVSIVSMVLSFFAVLGYLFVRHLFVANVPEMGTVRYIYIYIYIYMLCMGFCVFRRSRIIGVACLATLLCLACAAAAVVEPNRI